MRTAIAIGFKAYIKTGGSGAMIFDVEVQPNDIARVVLKPADNAQGVKVPVNELVGSELAYRLGLPCKEPYLVDVPTAIASQTHLRGKADLMQAGSAFAVPFITGDAPPTPEHVTKTDQPRHLPGIVAFDTWVANLDRNNAGNLMGSPSPDDPNAYRIWMIDQGHCFTGPGWTASTLAAHKDIPPASYLPVLEPGIQGALPSLAKWVDVIEQVSDVQLTDIVSLIPDAWLADANERQAMVDFLSRRRSGIRSVLATCFRISL